MMQSIKSQHKHYPASNIQYDVTFVGAGPYGLVTAPYLSHQQLNPIVFDKPMPLWREHMPPGMLLRSSWWATHVSDPKQEYGPEQFCQITGQFERITGPAARETVIASGLRFYQQAIPNTSQTYVRITELQDEVILIDGHSVDGTIVEVQRLRSPMQISEQIGKGGKKILNRCA